MPLTHATDSGFNYNINEFQFIWCIWIFWTVDCVIFFYCFFFSRICRLIFSSPLQCLFWKSLHYSLSWMILYRCTLSCGMTGLITRLTSASAVTTLSYSGTEVDWWPLFMHVLYSSILAGVSECFLNPWQFLVDTGRHRQIYWFIYHFLFLNQLMLGLVMVKRHFAIWAHLHPSNISDLFFFPPWIFKIFFYSRTSECPLFQNAKCNVSNYTGRIYFALIFKCSECFWVNRQWICCWNVDARQTCMLIYKGMSS